MSTKRCSQDLTTTLSIGYWLKMLLKILLRHLTTTHMVLRQTIQSLKYSLRWKTKRLTFFKDYDDNDD
jgi:hypothetical protein